MARRLCLGTALAGAVFLWWRYSIVEAPPGTVGPPYHGARLLVDHRFAWGRALERGDLVSLRYPGEAGDRLAVIAALRGDAVGEAGGRLLVAGERWMHAAEPSASAARGPIPAGAALFLNHAPRCPDPDGRTLGPIPLAAVTGRVIWWVGG